MNRRKMIATGAMALLAACTGGGQTTIATSGTFEDLLNGERRRRGLSPVAPSPELAAAARFHARDMALRGYFSHTGSAGDLLGNRVLDAGYRFCWAAENIAKGQESEAAVFTSWMNSRGHRENMLAPQAREYGLARDTGNVWVLVLGQSGC